MPWNHISEDTIVAPEFETVDRLDSLGRWRTGISKEPTGGTVEKTLVTWRCMGCRALAVTGPGEDPGKCFKCK
jgi:hypothetical protein